MWIINISPASSTNEIKQKADTEAKKMQSVMWRELRERECE